MKIQKTKTVEVLCAYTTPEMWKAVEQIKTAAQGNNVADAEYIAFIRLGLKENNGKGIITHYAKVKENGIKSDVPNSDYYKRVPELEKLYKEKSWSGPSKTYDLEWIKEWPNPVYHQKGDAARSQKYFYTTLDELKKAKVLSDMKTVAQLEAEKKVKDKSK